MYNKAILIGNLTKDPELRYTPAGTPVCGFRLAVTTKYSSQGENKEETLFIDITVFGKHGETCSQYLRKGRPVLVEGRLQEQRWEHEERQYNKTVLIAQNVRFLGKKDESAGSTAGAGSEAHTPPGEEADIEPF